ncbi:MAG: two-component system, cell cycle sensor histidine kinase and response regulator CckA [Verrucomicrobiota bacterium]|nr:two-component system, cell cycle sensor histidine kinase and response regulator CckA [Verrucomicrobiota bacterium]
MTFDQNISSAGADTLPWVLVVDDEESIRQIMVGFLRETGVEVVDAVDAASALVILGKRLTEPLIVFVDVVMPGMDGLTLSRKLRATLKTARIVLMSGQTSRKSWWPADLREIPFLDKPFRHSELVEMVRLARAENDGA